MTGLDEQRLENVDRVEHLRQVSAPPGVRADRLTLLDGPQCHNESEWHRDRPRKRQPERRRVPVGEQLDRDDARRRGEQRVLERTQAEDAHADVVVGQPGRLEGMDVDPRSRRAPTNGPKPAVTAARSLASACRSPPRPAPLRDRRGRSRCMQRPVRRRLSRTRSGRPPAAGEGRARSRPPSSPRRVSRSRSQCSRQRRRATRRASLSR